MRLVYKINLFVEKIGRVAKMLVGVAMALVITFLFVKNNDLTDEAVDDEKMIGHTIQKSVDTTTAQIRRIIKTINPIK